ncbi:MAG: hypothetical protein H6739_20890 [Alphaproteobacteria bacterium]|nr:hypothetical protein [Alphaproteobacteria bacterium]
MTTLWFLELEPARPVLEACYAPSPRGGEPWDPVVMLRCLLLGPLVGEPALNAWGHRLRAEPVLQAIAGLAEPEPGRRRAPSPSIGAFYSFLHRLHDGPLREGVAIRPSALERRRAESAQPGWERRKGKPEKNATAKLVDALRARRSSGNPDDLLGRLTRILWTCGVEVSVRRGLLEDIEALIVAGDASPLVTAANGHGRRVCSCPRTARCDHDRVWSDPDAKRGYDAYRDRYDFGYHSYELLAPVDGHDLPLLVRLDPADHSEHRACALAIEQLGKLLRDERHRFGLSVFIADAGHDARANHAHAMDWGMRPVIPLRSDVPAVHPTRPDIALSPRAIPLCQAGAEMAAWGTGGPNQSVFLCPVKANKLERCPLAPDGEPDWRCQPETKWGPVLNMNVHDNPRLFPLIARNSAGYRKLYKKRTGCERSNDEKKSKLKLEAARHRRWSFWLIRLNLLALLQHARAWVSKLDARAFVEGLMGRGPPAAHAA